MPNKDFADLIPRVAQSVPGCPNPMIEQHIRDGAIDVCERSLVWRYDQPLIRLTPDVFDYPYEPPPLSEVHAVLNASLNQSKMAMVTLDTLHDFYPLWPNVDPEDRGTPRFICQLDPDVFVVAPIPDDSQTYDVRMSVALKPLRDAASMDKTVLDEIELAVMHYALQHLLVIPGAHWEDKELAGYHARQYAYRAAERRVRANLGNARGSLKVEIPRFA